MNGRHGPTLHTPRLALQLLLLNLLDDRAKVRRVKGVGHALLHGQNLLLLRQVKRTLQPLIARYELRLGQPLECLQNLRRFTQDIVVLQTILVHTSCFTITLLRGQVGDKKQGWRVGKQITCEFSVSSHFSFLIFSLFHTLAIAGTNLSVRVFNIDMEQRGV